jgi:rhamnose transport system permease protein
VRRHLRGLRQRLIITRFKRAAADRDAGTLALYRGLAEGVSEARSVRGYPDWFYVLGQGAGVRRSDAALAAAHRRHRRAIVLGITTWGRATYAIGSNETAARFSGLRVDWVKLCDLFGLGFLRRRWRR